MQAFVYAGGVGATGLSSALAYGPVHAWEWLTLPRGLGVVAAVLLAACALPCAAPLGAVVPAAGADVATQPAESSAAKSVLCGHAAAWEQGRFVQFYGLGQWLGWLWPYALLVYVAVRLTRRSEPLRMADDQRCPLRNHPHCAYYERPYLFSA